MSFPAVGVEFGTKYMKLGAFPGEKMRVTPWENSEGSYDIPLYFNTSDKTIGRIARDTQSVLKKNEITFGLSHFIGAKKDDFFVKKLIENNTFPFSINYNEKKKVFQFNGTSVNEIAKSFLTQISEISKQKTRNEPQSLVFALPTHFTKEQRAKFVDLCKSVGLVKPRIVSDSTAAIFNFMQLPDSPNSGIFLHVNIGVTLEMSIVKVKDGKSFEILNNFVYPIFMSNVIESIIIDMVLDRFCAENKMKRSKLNIPSDKMEILRQKCEDAKLELSTKKYADVFIRSFLPEHDLMIKHLTYDDLYNKIDSNLGNMLSELANSIPEDIDLDYIVFTGSSSKMECLREQINIAEEVQASIALGAAQIALNGRNVTEKYVNPTKFLPVILPLKLTTSIGISVAGDKFITFLDQHATLPVSKTLSLEFKLPAKEGHEASQLPIQIYAGSSDVASENAVVDVILFSNIKPDEGSDSVFVSITMSVSDEGYLTVRAQTQNNLWNEKVVLSNKVLFTEEQIAEMKRDKERLHIRTLEAQYRAYMKNISTIIQSYNKQKLDSSQLVKLQDEEFSKEIPNNAHDLTVKLKSIREKVTEILSQGTISL